MFKSECVMREFTAPLLPTPSSIAWISAIGGKLQPSSEQLDVAFSCAREKKELDRNNYER